MNLKEIRLARGMTQKDVADYCGVSQSSLSLYESGICEPNLETLRKLATVLECTIDELVGNGENSEAK